MVAQRAPSASDTQRRRGNGGGSAEAGPRARQRVSARDGLRLSWPGRSWEPGAAIAGAPAACVSSELSVPAAAAGLAEARLDRLVLGDAADVARALASEGLEGFVDLIYVDPPFASQSEYVYEARLDGPADGRVRRATAYDDRWRGDGVAAYLDMLAPRLDLLCRLLSPRGTIWVHLDYRASYLVRVLLDEILGREGFVNEIVWRRAPNLGRQAASHQFGRTVDTLIVYGRGAGRASLSPPTRLEPVPSAAVRHDDVGRAYVAAPRGDYTDGSIAELEKIGRIHRTASGKIYVKYFLVRDDEGQWCRQRRVDALWTDVPPLRHAAPRERTGFPTQKPRALVDRIVACASPPGGLVVDLFAGSGTTGESAHALGRRFILGDASPLAVAAARARLLRAQVAFSLQSCGREAPVGERPCVAVERGGERLRITLLAPCEPLAWAVGPCPHAGAPFRFTWHSERVPGLKARSASREALLDAAGGLLSVRVWADDGSVGECTVMAP